VLGSVVNIIAAILASSSLASLLAGCQATLQRETPIGYACYRQFSHELRPRYYACLFELSAPSAFYDDKAVDKILSSFMAAEGGECTKQREREVADLETQKIDHGLSYRFFGVVCE
jgi:hypothetical protein